MGGLSINRDNIDLRAVEQIIDIEQVNAIGQIIKWAEDNVIDGKKSLSQVVEFIVSYIDKKGLININKAKGGSGNMAMPRKQEIMAAFNRFRSLKM